VPRHNFYQQCRLSRQSDDGRESIVTYLPSDRKLKPGRKVRFRNRTSEPWSEGWVVETVGRKREGRIVEEDETLYRRHRQVTDV